jgi:diadenosine tetraphosphate (Ap4A) HIT family hydrolase
LGSLVLAAKAEATAFADLSPAAFAELQIAVSDVERVLKEAVDYSRINYLMLMMVDPHVHFHVIPRYEGERSACGVSVADTGWPKVPALGEAVELEPQQVAGMTAWLGGLWKSGR